MSERMRQEMSGNAVQLLSVCCVAILNFGKSRLWCLCLAVSKLECSWISYC